MRLVYVDGVFTTAQPVSPLINYYVSYSVNTNVDNLFSKVGRYLHL